MRAPNARRMGVRRARTSRIAAPAARLSFSNRRTRSFAIVQLPDEAFQLGDVAGAELLTFGKMRDQRGEAAVEQAVDKALAFLVHPVGALHHRAIEILPAIFLRSDGFLL